MNIEKVTLRDTDILLIEVLCDGLSEYKANFMLKLDEELKAIFKESEYPCKVLILEKGAVDIKILTHD
jgi:hypothetical protein